MKFKYLLLCPLVVLSITSCDSGISINNITTSATLTEREEALLAYQAAEKQFADGNYMVLCSGEVVADALGFITYTQKVSSNKIKLGGELYFDTYSTSLIVNTAEQRYEDHDNDVYGYIQADGSIKNEGTLQDGYTGTAKWKDEFNSLNEDAYINEFGHFVNTITNYNLTYDFSECILNTSKYVDTANNETQYTYVVSVTDSDTTVDTTKEYAKEMDHMSGYDPKFTLAQFTLCLDSDSNLMWAKIEEQYNISVGPCTSSLTSKFIEIDSIDDTDIPQALKESYLGAKAKIAK